MTKKLAMLLCLVTLISASLCPVQAAPPQMAATQQKSLYQRLGGYDAIAAVSDDFIGRLATDPQLKRFFQGFSTDSQVKLRQHIVDFLCLATGGPCKYTGRDMQTAHTGLKITEDDWNVTVKHLVATLDQFKVPEAEKNEVLTAITRLKSDIVGR